jgi:aryl-alcohol dehydrogenase-like predicted oxidoreductase
LQPPYNLFERDAETDILPYAKAHDLVALGYGSLCRGLLTGNITETTTFKGDDLRNNNPKFKQERRGQYLAAVAKLHTLAEEKYGSRSLHLPSAGCWIGETISRFGAQGAQSN